MSFRFTKTSLSTQALILLVVVAGCGRYSAEHLALAEDGFKAGNYRVAVVEYEKAVRFSPNDPRAIRQLGLAHFRLGQLNPALAFLEKAQELTPDDPEAQLALADAYLAQRRFDAATKVLDAVLAKHPTNADAVARLGSTYLVQREPEKANAAFRKMIELSPNDPKGHYLLGLSLRGQRKPAEAANEFETAVRLGPTLIEPVAQLVEMDLVAQRSDAALARVQRQISIAGDSAKLNDLLGAVYAARGQNELAEKALLKAAAQQPNLADPLARLAQLYSSKGDDDAARAKANEAIKLEPNNTAALMVLALASQRKADPATARKYYEQALSVDSTSVVAANNLALLLAENGGSAVRALELAEVAKAAAPDDPHVLDTYGWVLYRAGNYEKAISVLRSSAAKLGNAPSVQYHFGMAAAKTGDTTTAKRALALAINSSAAFPEKGAAKKALAALR